MRSPSALSLFYNYVPSYSQVLDLVCSISFCRYVTYLVLVESVKSSVTMVRETI
jgi:hypothetical protein